MQIRKMRLCI